MDLFATTAKEMEPLLADELRTLGGDSVEERRAGVAFAGSLEVAYRVCLWSRVASRVLLPLATFDAPDERALYEGVRAIRWADHLGPSRTLAVDFASSHSALTHTHFGALRTKDAIVDQLREERGARPSVDVASPDLRVNVYLHEDRATVSIDLSGESLHRRGYRAKDAPAPLKESLAAAVLLAAGWPDRARSGQPLYDPMCGSGTLPIEAAQIAAERAPGLARERFGFHGWLGHAPEPWARLVEEARAREVRDPKRLPQIVGHDADPRAVRAALESVERAGLRGRVHIEKRALSECVPIGPGRAGLVVVNPPYGERVGEAAELGPLYQELGDRLRRHFPGWVAFVLTGNPELAKRIGLRPARRQVLYNGAIECRLLEYPISQAPVRDDTGPAWRKPRPEAAMFSNRVQKNLRHLSKWAKREGVTCFRVYDADLPEYAVAVDLYERAAHVQEYRPPATVDAAKAAERLRDIVAVLPEALGIAAEDLFLKVRHRQRPGEQYQRADASGDFREVREGGGRFLVNLADYLDTGLFLDHRTLRQMVGSLAKGRDFLNLFAYTGTATVYAGLGGARTTTSVDLSHTYLDWARRNLEANGLSGRAHRLVREDVLTWLRDERRHYGVILLAPPTFSNSKSMAEDFDLQRDHPALLTAVAALLEEDGVLLFSTHSRRFHLATDSLTHLLIEELTHKTIPRDFARAPRTHRTFRVGTLADRLKR